MSRPIFNSITSEGGLLPADFLHSLLAPKPTVDGLKPADYHLDPNDRLNDVIAGSWNKLRSRWQTFRTKISGRPAGESTTSETRELWLQPLLGELGFGRVPVVRGLSFGDRTFDISHQWDSIPLHLVGTHVDLDQRTPGATGASRGSPHSIVQQLLNADPQRLWGVVSNGWQLRLLRDNAALTRQAYIEFDLQSIFDGDLYPEFVVLWLVLHQSRFEAREGQHTRCWLEMWRQAADQKGLRALEHLRYGVESAITSLGAGLLSNPHNGPLREALSSGQLTTQALYQQILRTVYRMIFLFVAEDRGLLHPRDQSEEAIRARARYAAHYSLSRLRELQLSRAGTPHPDLWIVFQLVTRKLGEEGAPELALPILGSFLWSAGATKDLNGCLISNRQFLEAVHALAFTQEEGGLRRTVDYRNLGAEELGSVYEGLLEQHVSVDPAAQSFALDTAAGNERKTSGSYYTPDSLVQCLLDSALEPVVSEAARGKTGEVAAKALLALKICDPAVGSGHFLIAAAHRLAKRVAAARTGEEEPSPEATRSALRDVIGRCLYGVDINPMSAELCRVSLWLEALEPGKPLSFLDHHIRCGNSLLGATPELIKGGIPDEAYETIEGDDREACAALKKRNKRENPKLGDWFVADEAAIRDRLHQAAVAIDEISDGRPEDIRRKEVAFRAAQSNYDFGKAWDLANLWCAAFVVKKDFPEVADSELSRSNSQLAVSPAPSETQAGLFGGTEDVALKPKGKKSKAQSRVDSEIPFGITTQHLRDFVDGVTLPDGIIGETKRLAHLYQFFHYHLAFPEVFAQGGFDVSLGNPPWEAMSAEEQEFFATRCPSIVAIATRSKRLLAIEALRDSQPSVYNEWIAYRRRRLAESQFCHSSQLYPLTGQGNLNSYLLFTERCRELACKHGRVGLILPSAVASGESGKELFQDLIDSNALVCLFDFENRAQLFPDVHSSMKFSLLVASQGADASRAVSLAFNLRSVTELSDPDRKFTLSPADFFALNPNTRTAATFSSLRDAKLVLFFQQKHPVLCNESIRDSERPWRVECMRMVDLSYESEHFYSETEVAANGFQICLDYYRKDGEVILPVYEAKMTQQYDHRAADVVISKTAQIRSAQQDSLSEQEHENPMRFPHPRFWMADSLSFRAVPEWYVSEYLLAYTLVTSPTNNRTMLACVMPKRPAGHSLRLIYLHAQTGVNASFLLAALNSFACDYICRNKIGGVNLNPVIAYQLPVPHPKNITEKCLWGHESLGEWISARVLELTYTAWDLKSFAQDCGYSGPPFLWDDERRFLIRCELDAALFHLYLGLESHWRQQDDALSHMFPAPRDAVHYMLETFPIVKRKDEAKWGAYRTKRTIIEIFDELTEATRTGKPYETRLEPRPADPRAAHGSSTK